MKFSGYSRWVLLACALFGALSVSAQVSLNGRREASAKAAFEALPEAERRALQEALVWTGDHSSITTGSFGRRTYEAIVAFQRRMNAEPNGVLDSKQRAHLVATEKREREAVGFSLILDPATGVELGIPERVLVNRGPSPAGAPMIGSRLTRLSFRPGRLP
jgi:hypothetical protein